MLSLPVLFFLAFLMVPQLYMMAVSFFTVSSLLKF